MKHSFRAGLYRLMDSGYWLAIVIVALPGVAWGAQTGITNSTTATNKTAVVTNDAPKVLIKSYFEVNPDKMGKDPFFPETARVQKPNAAKPGVTGGTAPPVTAMTMPVVGGVYRSRNRPPSVELNGQEFVVGERHQLRLGNTTNEVRCLEIRNDTILVTIDGKRYTIPIPE